MFSFLCRTRVSRKYSTESSDYRGWNLKCDWTISFFTHSESKLRTYFWQSTRTRNRDTSVTKSYFLSLIVTIIKRKFVYASDLNTTKQSTRLCSLHLFFSFVITSKNKIWLAINLQARPIYMSPFTFLAS